MVLTALIGKGRESTSLEQWAKIVSQTTLSYLKNPTIEVIVGCAPETKSLMQETMGDSERVSFVKLSKPTKGALATACVTLAQQPVSGAVIVIAAADTTIGERVLRKIDEFASRGYDLGVVCFENKNREGHWSWVHSDNSTPPKVTGVFEGEPQSGLATAGIFLFRSKDLFMSASGWVFKNNAARGGQFYTSAALNYALANGMEVKALRVDRRDIYKHAKAG